MSQCSAVTSKRVGRSLWRCESGRPVLWCLPRDVWTCLGVLELVCGVGLIVPGALHWRPMLTVVAAVLLTIESSVFVWVHMNYTEATPIIMTAVLGLVMCLLLMDGCS
ncbi:DoxX family protein [Granulicella arctica]|uniref:DoxX family protein n=1 Tax=Granulicella arctica TaxID=940613 RepID=UPI0021E0B900|nr:DoxX family protein [Granulicella arctica]